MLIVSGVLSIALIIATVTAYQAECWMQLYCCIPVTLIIGAVFAAATYKLLTINRLFLPKNKD